MSKKQKLTKETNKDKKKDFLTRQDAEKAKKYKNHTSGRFFVTSAVAGAEVDLNFLKSVETFCNKNNAKLIVLLMREHQAPLNKQEYIYAPEIYELYQRGLAVTEYVFNKNLRAMDAQLNPQQIMPLTGLNRYGIADGGKFSILVASPKQHMQCLPTGNDSYPRIMHSTGVITVPNYLKNRAGRISEQDHTIGGLIVEIKNDKFALRQVQSAQDGSFISLGVKYKPDGKTEKVRAEAFVMGDLHAGMHCQKTLNAWYEVFKEVQPKRIALHDIFDGLSISHHLINKPIERLNRPSHLSTLEAELATTKIVIDEIKKNAPKDAKVYIIPANHNEHLDKYLDEYRYVNDDTNVKLAHELQTLRMKGVKNILQFAIDRESSCIWLDRNSDFIVEGFNLNVHGDIGPNGSRGGPAGLELAYGKAIAGHSHTPGIRHKMIHVGTTSLLKLGYNKGPSSWLNASSNLYEGGLFEIIISVDGTWKY